MDSKFNKRFWLLAAVFLFFCLLLTPLGNFNDWISPTVHTGFYSIDNIDPGDDTGYYSYLRSGALDGDLDFINERNYAHRETFMPTGYVFNNWQIGQSVLFLPFFLAGHFLALLLKSSGLQISTDGYSLPYYMSTAIASHAYLFFGLLQLNKILKRATTEQIALWVTISIWLCSPLIYFSFIRQRMAHTAEFFMAVTFVSLWLRTRESEKQMDHALLGALLGLFCMVRIINISFFALYFFDQINLRKSLSKNFLVNSLWTLLFFLIALSPQLFMWQKLNGVPLPIRHFEMASAGLTFVFFPEFFKKLFNIFWGSQWGLLFSFPILFFSLIGLYANKRLNSIRSSVVVYIAAIFFIISIYPESSDSYGERHFISSLPLLAFGLAGFLNWASSKNTKVLWYFATGLIGICFLIQYCMITQYKIIIFHNDPEFSLKAIANIPKLFFEHPQTLLRSSNWFRLLTLDHESAWNVKDFLLLIVFPITQSGVLFLIYFSFERISGLKQKNNFSQKHYLTATGFIAVSLILLIAILTPAKNKNEIQVRNHYADLLKQADLYRDKNQTDRAMKYYIKASNQGLPTITPYIQLGLMHQSKNNFAESNRNFQKALEFDLNHQIARINLGDNFNILGDYENAEKNLKVAIRSQSPMPEAFDVLGQIYAKQNRLNDSERMFKTAITLQPNYVNGHLNLAILYTQIGKKEDAIYHLKETVRLGAHNQTVANLLNSYGLSLQKMAP